MLQIFKEVKTTIKLLITLVKLNVQLFKGEFKDFTIRTKLRLALIYAEVCVRNS